MDKWLADWSMPAGAVTTTDDVKIEHTKQKDVVWFYASILGVPSLLLGLGLFYVRRSRGAAGRA